MRHIKEYVLRATELGLYPKKYEVIGKAHNQWKIKDPDNGTVLEVVNFCCNDVLGLAQHPDVKRAAIEAV